MTATTTELHEYDVRDPARLIADIADRVSLIEGSAHLALVRAVSTEQRVLRVDTLTLPAEIVDWQEGSEELKRVVDTWQGPARARHPVADACPGDRQARPLRLRRERGCLVPGRALCQLHRLAVASDRHPRH